MQTFFDFLIDYKEIILTFVCIVVSVIGLFLKKRPKTLDNFIECLLQVSHVLPSLISEIESPGNGANKKEYVITRALEMMEIKLSRKLTSQELILCSDSFSKDIEAILSTPQKKGK